MPLYSLCFLPSQSLEKHRMPWAFHYGHILAMDTHFRMLHTQPLMAGRPPLASSTAPRRATSTSIPQTHRVPFLDVAPHRPLAVVRLLRIEQDGAYADALNEVGVRKEMEYLVHTLGFHIATPDPRSQKLVTDTVAGVTRWKRYLDFLLYSHYEREKYDKIEPLLLQILRLGVYELVKLETVPYAVINETVKIAKTALRTGAGNLVNWLLRSISVNQKSGELPVPILEGDERAQARVLAILHSHPVWMVRRWIARYGKEQAIKLMEWNNTPPTYALRLACSKGVPREHILHQLSELNVSYQNSVYLSDFVRIVTGLQAVIQDGLIARGLCVVQDESTGHIVKLVDPQPEEVIVDCCAAPGGKALYIASLLQGQGKLVALDLHRGRLQKLQKMAEALGVATLVNSYHDDLREFAIRSSLKADKVLLDVPCSGLGVLSKRADLRWRRVPDDLQQLLALQTQLLDAAALLVKPGGALVYSTCSIEPDENENLVMLFLAQHPEFYIDHAEMFCPKEFITKEGFFASIPHRDRMDGAFAARLRRQTI